MFLEQTKDRKFSLTPTKVLRLLQRHDSAPETLPIIVSRDSKGRLPRPLVSDTPGSPRWRTSIPSQ